MAEPIRSNDESDSPLGVITMSTFGFCLLLPSGVVAIAGAVLWYGGHLDFGGCAVAVIGGLAVAVAGLLFIAGARCLNGQFAPADRKRLGVFKGKPRGFEVKPVGPVPVIPAGNEQGSD